MNAPWLHVCLNYLGVLYASRSASAQSFESDEGPGPATTLYCCLRRFTAGQETTGRFFGRSPLGPCLPCGAEQTPLSQWLRPLGRSLWLSSALSEPSAVSLPDLGAPTYAACLYGPTGKQKLRGERSGKRPIDSLPAVENICHCAERCADGRYSRGDRPSRRR